MDLWEKYTSRENISVANLKILATNFMENEFLGAIDILSLDSNVKYSGSALYYKYMLFKDRVKNKD